MHVIGTAGHVDHGKSSLVQALTGTDPDRLREEKERGLTIELGFALLALPNGDEAGIVDVPGHERFIKTMLAGVGGIDLALLVVAADEGVMPQTREHLAIIDLLGIDHGVVALTKSDLVEPEVLELAAADIAEDLAGTTLEGATIVPCSAVTGSGLDDLANALERALSLVPVARDIRRPHLPVDRAFTMKGFGTVVTGTLIGGSLANGLEVELVPSPPSARVPRIRGLQSHGRSVAVAEPGSRTAINLSGVDVNEIRRGMVVATRGWLTATSAIDVRLRAVAGLPRPIRHGVVVSFHTGAAEVSGRLLLLDRDELRAGDVGWAQVRLAEPIAVLRGDAFIIRDPNQTLGGGRIVATDAKRHRRHHALTIANLDSALAGSLDERIAALLARREPVAAADVAHELDASPDETLDAIRELSEQGEVVALGVEPLGPATVFYSRAGFANLTARMTRAVVSYHNDFPLRRGIPREELRARLALEPPVLEAAVQTWIDWEAAKAAGPAIAMPSHEPRLNPEQEARAAAFLAEVKDGGFAPSPTLTPAPETVAYLEELGEIVRTGDGVIFSREVYDQMALRISAHIRDHGSVTLAQVRDMFGTSRRYAQSLLEYLDAQRITRRSGDTRVLRKP